jgi:hypothetical protein
MLDDPTSAGQRRSLAVDVSGAGELGVIAAPAYP